MLNKNAQLTIFIIIAILIIAVIVLFFAFRSGIQREKPTSPEIAPIKNFVEECIYNVGEDALFFIGLHGGYYVPPRFSISLGIPYYIKNNKTLMPSKENIELEISKYVDEALLLCAGNLSEFNNFQIAQGKPKTSAKIFDERVILNVNYPLTIIREEEKSRIAKFENEIPVRLGKIYNASSFIVSEHLKREICMSCLLELQEKENLSIMSQDSPEESSTIIYNIFDENYLFEGEIPEIEKYLFRFAVEY
ncbi:MAG: hypothetical protein QT10_C0002G0040 [archaeon GW2011_AR19]|nr:MAG: hypothetical protein QT10_C0002G0040 [archaeon GW2011_AR19]